MTDTDIVRSRFRSSNARESVDLPAPDGEDNPSIKPRRGILNGRSFASLNVLHLLTKLVDGGLEVDADVRQFDIV